MCLVDAFGGVSGVCVSLPRLLRPFFGGGCQGLVGVMLLMDV